MRQRAAKPTLIVSIILGKRTGKLKVRDVTALSWSTAQLEGADEATETFLKITHFGNNPALGSRLPDCPVGLKVCCGPFTDHSGIN